MRPTPPPRKPRTRLGSIGPDRLPAFFLAITVLYLLVEVPFAALLLDTLGSNPTIHEIERIEQTGRLLSGIAIALAVVGITLPKDLRWSRRPILKNLIVFGCITAAVFQGEKWLIDSIARSASDDFRRAAAFSVLAKDEAVVRRSIGSLSLPDNALSSAALGFTPILVASLDDPEGWLDDPEGTATRLVPDDVFPDLQEFEDTILAGTLASMGEDMKGTIAEKRYRRILFPSPERAASEAFEESSAYTREWMRIRKYRVDRGSLPRRIWLSDAAKHSRNWNLARGIDLGPGMSANDFLDRDAYLSRAIPAIRRAQSSAIDKARHEVGDIRRLDPSENPFLVADDLESYARNESVQAKARARLDIEPGEYTHVIAPDMSEDAKRDLHDLLSRKAKLRFVSSFIDDSRNENSFGREGEQAIFGENAVRTAIVPLFALTLSLLGGLLHVGKATNFALLTFAPAVLKRKPMRLSLAVGAVLVCIVALYEKPQAFAGHELLDTERRPGIVSSIVHANLTLQPRFRPVAHSIGEIGPFAWIRPAIEGRYEAYSNWDWSMTPAVADDETFDARAIPIPTRRPMPSAGYSIPIPVWRPAS